MATSAFTTFDPADKITTDNVIITETLWSPEIGGVLSTFYTSSVQVASTGDYYYDVYQTDPVDDIAAVQFSIAYGNLQGSGSYEKFTNMGVSGYTPSKAIYSQYANILLPANTNFSLYNGNATTSFIAISFERERVKEILDPGNWELTLDNGAGTITTLIDDNFGTEEASITDNYNIVSGSFTNGIYSSVVYYGKVYPKFGIMILDAAILLSAAGVNITVSEHSTSATNNNYIMFAAIKAGASFEARNKQTLSSQYYFVRVKNNAYNNSTNPTYYSGSYGYLRFPDFVSNPVSYITTVGLYDNYNRLLSVAKLSQPIKKTKTTESLIRVCLNF